MCSGIPRKELTSPQPPPGRVHPEDQAAVADAISRVVVGGPAKTLSYRFLHGSGTWRWLETTWSCIRTTPVGGDTEAEEPRGGAGVRAVRRHA